MKIIFTLRSTLRVVIFLFTATTCSLNQDLLYAADSVLDGYATPQEFEKQISDLAKLPNVKVKSLAKTKEGRDVWLIALGDESKAKSAILVMGSVEASHLLGSEAVVRMAKSIAESTDKKSKEILLDRVTIYMIPRPSPDATAKCWKTLLEKPTGNARASDDDRDGKVGEDPANDLNGDKLITMMRVTDPQGKYRLHPDDSRVLVEADPKKNETGTHNLFTEGRDDDHDEQFNEDGSSGVNFNRNFTHKYPFFKAGAGPHQVSEPETRAVADFCFDHPEIAIVFSFTPEDNLFHPWKAGQDTGPIKRSIARDDVPQSDFIAKHYTEIQGSKNPPDSATGAGSFSEWAYYHYGRWSFGARGWWIPEVEKAKSEKSDTADDKKESEKKAEKKVDAKKEDDATEPEMATDASANEKKPYEKKSSEKKSDAKAAAHNHAHDDDDSHAKAADSKTESAKKEPATIESSNESTKSESTPRGRGGRQRGNRAGAVTAPPVVESQSSKEQLNALRWLEREKIAGFTDWKNIEHPDFPGQTVEVGGFHPLVLLNPPAKELDGIVEKHVKFVTWLAELLPKIMIRDVRTESLGKGIYRVRLRVANTGYLATASEMGQTTRQVPPLTWDWTAPEGIEWLQGTRRGFIERLPGISGQAEQEWLIRLTNEKPTTLKLQVGAPSAGTTTADIELKP